jgi:hypothetical protein
MPIATTQSGLWEKKARSGRNGKPPEISRGAAFRRHRRQCHLRGTNKVHSYKMRTCQSGEKENK